MVNSAEKVFQTLCGALDNMKWRYVPDEKNLKVTTSAVGKDLTIPLQIVVSAQRNVLYIKSPLPFKVEQSKVQQMCLAVVAANFSMLNGSFEYDTDSGYIGFKVLAPFVGCELGQETCRYLILLACSMTDKFNDKFFQLVQGTMTLQQFVEFAKK